MGTSNSTAFPIRQNPQSLPASMRRRNEPTLTLGLLRSRSPQFRALAAQRAALKPGPVKPRIVSSAHGQIRSVLLTFPAYAAGEYSYRSVYIDLMKKLPPKTKFIILTHPSVAAELKAALKDAKATARTTIVDAPEYLQFLVWAEDPFVVVEDVGRKTRATFFVEPFTFRRAGDAVISDLVAGATALKNTQSPLYFQGGNVLIGDDFVLIGVDYPSNTLELVEQAGHIRIPEGVDAAEFIRELYQKTFDPTRRLLYAGSRMPVPQYKTRPVTINGESWQEEVYLGTGQAQPIFHIDMFISLAGRSRAGKYRLVVGSPAMADELLGRAPIPHAMAEIFDDVARTLKEQGFEIVRNPLPLTYVDDVSNKLRTWYFATANNCLVQIDGADKRVWLPTYGHGDWADLAVIDARNKEIWRKMGFAVTELTDFHPFAQNLGAVDCIKKYLKRSV